MLTPAPFEVICKKAPGSVGPSTSVAISCFKYGREGGEALDSLLRQTEDTMNLVLVDDCSPDDSAEILQAWLDRHRYDAKLSGMMLVRHLDNQGLSQSRNTALSLIETPYVFILDADNQLHPRALKTLREAIEHSGYSMAYSIIEKFGAEQGLMNNSLWLPKKFSYGNYIDAMALIRMEVLREIGGYRVMPNKFGWEDYDLWCSFVDRGLMGCHVPEILCRYRTHDGSMLRNVTNPFFLSNVEEIRADFKNHHRIPILF